MFALSFVLVASTVPGMGRLSPESAQLQRPKTVLAASNGK
jgi:hypothetical protein